MQTLLSTIQAVSSSRVPIQQRTKQGSLSNLWVVRPITSDQGVREGKKVGITHLRMKVLEFL